ncbi:hypothetical protein TVAG_551830 [Trichomonas vaginalis G3]|uniref:Uncharacterized protein n=1 Tax=Trichomonas vaginalis (strain ATCC PRA-98 / G3) TaxID=412133 RepID=A2FX21_TRIV3|nr:armadillo (ARM) repeat-containing protein family [Trichomonas vaginalis G3]EAX90543.1 hypothetical protein TVAG_551830 [Trichomonas vaginalis G3]KAI5497744.1 armadillo (ARM) repeat-containing protein family [Trichomonas vaginalis G3]|eukprot:XP_001303473.1 hypothetical protein [Trichomonas vaginalis G3]
MNVYKPDSSESNIIDDGPPIETFKSRIDKFLINEFIEITQGHSNSDRPRVRDSIRRLKLKLQDNPEVELDYELFEKYDIMNILFYYMTLPLTNSKENANEYKSMKEVQDEATKTISYIFEYQSIENFEDFLDSFDFKERISHLLSMQTVTFAEIALRLLNSLLNNKYPNIELYIFDIMNLEQLFNYTVELLKNLEEREEENKKKKEDEDTVVVDSASEFLFQYGLLYYLVSRRTLDNEYFVKYLLNYTFESHAFLNKKYPYGDSYLLWVLIDSVQKYPELVMPRTATPKFMGDLYEYCKSPFAYAVRASIVLLYYMFKHNLDPRLLDTKIFLELLEKRISGKEVLQPFFICLKDVIENIGVSHDFLVRLVYLLNIYLDEINYTTICLIIPVIISIVNTGILNLDELLDSNKLNLFDWIEKYGDSEDAEFMNGCMKCIEYVFGLAEKNNVLEEVKNLFIDQGLDDVFDTMEETYNNDEFSTRLDIFKSTYFPE